MPKRTRRRWSAEEKAEILRRFRDSGLSKEAFARTEGISGSGLGNWLRKERERGASESQPALVAVCVKPREASLDEGFLEIVVRGDRRIRVRPGFDETAVRRLVVVLEQC